jgi:hypothetical protein
LNDAFHEHDYVCDIPEVVSVSFKPEALTTFEEWRMFLVRIASASKRPGLRMALGLLYLLFALPFLGFMIGMAGWPRLQPDTAALMGFGVGLLFPYRVWRTKNTFIKALRGLSPITIELDRECVSVRAKHRHSRIDWAGVVELRTTSREIVLRYNAGDVSWIPTRVFASPEHEARFLEIAKSCLKQEHQGSVSQLVRSVR